MRIRSADHFIVSSKRKHTLAYDRDNYSSPFSTHNGSSARTKASISWLSLLLVRFFYFLVFLGTAPSHAHGTERSGAKTKYQSEGQQMRKHVIPQFRMAQQRDMALY